ncbi:MAG TPA: NAD(P)-dependent oxidoreductase, partial [Bacteroidota bacterium]|nr:NAD(P)-dependent oxidoreductase [Bacteroidota bacterium]
LNLSRRIGGPSSFCGKFTRGGLGTEPSDTADDWITSDGAHALDLAIATIGLPHSFSASRKKVGLGPDNVWMIQLFGKESSAFLVFDFGAGRRIERYEWTGPGYDVVLELPDRAEWAQHNGVTEQWQSQSLTGSDSPVENYGYADEYRVFLNAISGLGPRPEVDFHYASRYMRIATAILGSNHGVVTRIPQPIEVETPRGATDRIIVPAVHHPASRRPVVTILQEPAIHAKYFNFSELRSLAEILDLRFPTSQQDISKDLAESHAIVTGWDAPLISDEQFDLAEKLELVVVVGSSVKIVKPELLKKRGVALCNTADAIAKSVSEHCLLLSLAGLRKLTNLDRQMHQGKWPPGNSSPLWLQKAVKVARRVPGARGLKPLFPKSIIKSVSIGRGNGGGTPPWADLRGQTIGLVGWGHIASNFARLLASFSCKVLVYSESASSEELEGHGVQRATLGEVLGGSRVVSLHRGVTERTIGMIGEKELALLRSGTVLVNTARAALIDETALLARLKQGDIVAALDVFSREPLPPGHPLQKLDNVILTPHMSNISRECYLRVGTDALRILRDWKEGRTIPVLLDDRIEKMT